MKPLKPKRLQHGDVIGICAPASPPASESKLNKGIRYLEQLGYRVEIGKNVLKKKGYLAGTDKQRADDINTFFADHRIKAIFTVRGGYGSQRILPLLNYNLIRWNPKILVGYSDITALHLALLSQCGLVTFSGPMVAVEMSEGLSGNTEEQFWSCLASTQPPDPFIGKPGITSSIHRKAISTGRLVGGNLSILSSLVGSPNFPKQKKLALIIEEIDERPYRVDRMLQQLQSTGIFKNVTGLVLGDFSTCVHDKGKSSLSIQEVFKSTFDGYNFPIVSNLCYGHMKNSRSFPIGVRVSIDGKKHRVIFLESGVTV